MGIPEYYSKIKALKIIWEMESWKEFWNLELGKLLT